MPCDAYSGHKDNYGDSAYAPLQLQSADYLAHYHSQIRENQL